MSTLNPDNSVLLCPRNDEESVQILQIASAMQIPTVISMQPHGARLNKEDDLEARLKQSNPQATHVAIVEIPGPAEEAALAEHGYHIHLIDHHRYNDVNRMDDRSSLEQFLALYGIDDKTLRELGFDPRMVGAVAALDRGFIWELIRSGYVGEEKKQAIAYYRDLSSQLEDPDHLEEIAEAQRVWATREDLGPVIFVKSDKEHLSIRDAISYLVAETFEEPRPVMIVQGKRRMYVQDTNKAAALHKAFGGFTFGRDMCWGILSENRELPNIDDVLQFL